MGPSAAPDLGAVSKAGLIFLMATLHQDAEMHAASAEILKNLSETVKGELVRRVQSPSGPAGKLAMPPGVSGAAAKFLATHFQAQAVRVAETTATARQEVFESGGIESFCTPDADEILKSIGTDCAGIYWALLEVCAGIAGQEIPQAGRA